MYKWDGFQFAFDTLDWDPPTYRFQASEDADRYFNAGRYDKALSLYQDTIFSNKLKYWTFGMKNYLTDLEMHQPSDPTPTLPTPDPNEYPILAAYARYRIMLLHLTRNDAGDASTVYQTLQQKVSKGSPGYSFVEMATLLWNNYQQRKNLTQSCEPVVKYVQDHWD